jgi:hypothetical protein
VEVLLTLLAVIAAGAILVFFMNSRMGMQLIHKKSVSTIINCVTAIQRSAPQTPLHEIYLYALRDAGCFDPRTAPQPEQFAELMASVEEKIRLHASGVTK